MKMCTKWKGVMTQLTKYSWKQKIDHQWNGEPHDDEYLKGIINRMYEIIELRSQHDELLRLLSDAE
jgi:dynein heavy chain 2